ncbi:MAG: hypothetical protein EXR98_06395 [Gemmataceae bacterium]|nr:hypothetical protein [Gemmataceae bacterium]
MRNLLALIGLVVVLVGGVGWYLGWYSFGTEPGKVEVDFNTKKIAEDVRKGGQKVGEFLHGDQQEKKVEGKVTSNQKDSGDGWKIVPGLLPKINVPEAPTGRGAAEFNPDGTPKVNVPPPPSFPGAK